MKKGPASVLGMIRGQPLLETRREPGSPGGEVPMGQAPYVGNKLQKFRSSFLVLMLRAWALI